MLLRFERGDITLRQFRQYVYEYHETDDEVVAEAACEDLFSVLVPYLLDKESLGDSLALERMTRLRQVLQTESKFVVEKAVFAIDYDRIQLFLAKLTGHKINQRVFEEQLAKLSPAQFDVRRIAVWAYAHDGANVMNLSLLSQ